MAAGSNLGAGDAEAAQLEGEVLLRPALTLGQAVIVLLLLLVHKEILIEICRLF